MNKSSGGKVKKRKTRKCLDEIRKKSLCVDVSNKQLQHKHSNDFSRLKIGIPKITNSRLTMKLGMFSKGVRSETIMRPHLSDEFKARKDENLNKIIDLANGQPTHTVTSGAYEKLLKTNGIKHSTSEQSEDEAQGLPFAKRAKLSTAASEKRSPTPPPAVLSPQCRTQNQILNVNNSAHRDASPSSEEKIVCVDSSASPTKASSIDEDLYGYYKEWMDGMPDYLSENVPKLIDDDTIERTKHYLQRIYSEIGHRQSDNTLSDVPAQTNRSNIIEQTMRESILLNPIEYIKMYGRPDSTSVDSAGEDRSDQAGRRHASREVPASSPKYITANAERSTSSYSFSLSPENRDLSNSSSESSRRMSVAEQTSLSLIENSPVFTFYPRKLNP